jgi:outer membrane protein TolC
VIAAVIDVTRRVRAARQRAEVAQRAIELASANLATELALFRNDKSSNVLVFERQQELDEARLLASRAAADCQIAIATLDYLTGHLLDRYGVEVMSTRKGARK